MMFIASLSSCSLKTEIVGEFLFDTNFVLKKEFDSTGLERSDFYFIHDSVGTQIFLKNDRTCRLTIKYQSEETKIISGNYRIVVGDVGHSGHGSLNFPNYTVPVNFKESYWLIFDMPPELNPSGKTDIRTVQFQRWGS